MCTEFDFGEISGEAQSLTCVEEDFQSPFHGQLSFVVLWGGVGGLFGGKIM